MNLKLFALSIVAATGLVSSSFLVSTPAEAATIVDGDTLAFSGLARFNKGSGFLDFGNGLDGDMFDAPGSPTGGVGSVSIGSTRSVFGAPGSQVNLKDLMLTQTSETSWAFIGASLPEFLSLPGSGIKFQLDTFVLSLKNDDWLAQYTGVFSGDNTISGRGGFDPLEDESFATIDGSFYISKAKAQAVPTPALLPGLLGMGVAALRKRNQNEEGAEENS